MQTEAEVKLHNLTNYRPGFPFHPGLPFPRSRPSSNPSARRPSVEPSARSLPRAVTCEPNGVGMNTRVGHRSGRTPLGPRLGNSMSAVDSMRAESVLTQASLRDKKITDESMRQLEFLLPECLSWLHFFYRHQHFSVRVRPAGHEKC